MPLLGLFSKRDKHRQSSNDSVAVTSVSSRSESEAAESDYILNTSNSPASRNGHNVYNGPTGASSSKLKMPGFRRKGQHESPAVASEVGNATRDPKSSAFSSAASEADLDLLKVPLPDKKSLFASPAYGDPLGARSTRSLPNERGHFRQGSQDSIRADMGKKQNNSTPSAPNKKSGGLFSWATRERTKSKPTRPPSPPVESFNLKAFRHVGPDSPSASPRPVSPSPSIPFAPAPPVPRPRGNSVASESSQRISVAAFREAQARRSAAPSPVPSLRPPSTLDLPRSIPTTPSQSPRVSVVQPTGPRAQIRPLPPPPPPPPRRSAAPSVPANSSSDEESDDEEEESDSGAEATLRPGRQRTITQKSRSELGHRSPGGSSNRMQKQLSGSKSELGHGLSPRLRSTPSGDSTGESPSSYNRARASASTSALTPNAAAKRASEAAAANAAAAITPSLSTSAISAHKRQPAHNTDTSESESSRSEDEEDEDDAPLARLVHPKRPGTAMSTVSTSTAASRTRKPSQPLIDVSALGPSPPLPHKEREENTSSMPTLSFSPVSLTERLASLTKGLGGKSVDNLAPIERDPATASAAAMKQPEPKRNTSSPTTSDVPELFSFSPILANADRTSSPVNTDAKGITSSPESLSPSTSPVEPTKRIVPTPVRQRESPPSFSVTSRPRSTHTLSEPSITTESRVIQPPPRTSSYAALNSPPAPPRITTSYSSSSSSQSSTVRPPTLVSLIPPGSGFGGNSIPKPFAGHSNDGRGLRGNSPASSTGDSSSGRAPYTPKDGSDYGNDRGWDSKSTSNISSNVDTARRRGHKKSSSVTFEDEVNRTKEQERERGRPTTVTKERLEMTEEEAEQKRRERRRGEAKAAIELGNLVNGRGPIDNDDEEDEDVPIGAANMGPRMNILNAPNSMMGGMSNGMPNMNFNPQPPQPMPWAPWTNGAPPTPMLTPQATGIMSPQAFMIPPPPPGCDPTFFAAHERAMMIAKQTYQMAVAQQAMAAAADEWERNSTYAGSTYGGPASTYNGSMGMGMGGLAPGWPNGGMMFPAGPRSAYAASDAGSDIGGGGWGSRSVYGESFGPPRSSGMQGFYPPRADSMAGPGQQSGPPRASMRPRTKSSPHEQIASSQRPPMPGQAGKKPPPPPSSWTMRYQTALRDGS